MNYTPQAAHKITLALLSDIVAMRNITIIASLMKGGTAIISKPIILAAPGKALSAFSRGWHQAVSLLITTKCI